MKKIFNWMREQMHEARFPITDLKVGVKVNGIQATDDAVLFERANELINEAEAKWEADCCEWKFNEFEEQWETSCGVLLNPNSNDIEATFYCCHCGKPIKIVEVE